MDNNNLDNKEEPDLSSRLDEDELLKPGTEVKPGDNPKTEIEQKTAQNPKARPNQQPQDDNSARFYEFEESERPNDDVYGTQETKKSGLKTVWEIAKTLLIAVVAVIIINTFVFQAYYVSGNSMNPTYKDGDYLLVDKFQTSFNTIKKFFGSKSDLDLKRGDVIVFHPPQGENIFYIKRVIATPGERVTLKNGIFTIYNDEYPEGFKLEEKYIDPSFQAEGDVDEVVQPGNVFVVGDNRSPGGSYDSREWGQLPENKISGRAFFRLIPLSGIGFISPAQYTQQ